MTGSSETVSSPISEQMVNAAQQARCDGLVNIGAVAAEGGDVRRIFVCFLFQRQKSLNLLSDSSVYRTVCWIFLCPR